MLFRYAKIVSWDTIGYNVELSSVLSCPDVPLERTGRRSWWRPCTEKSATPSLTSCRERNTPVGPTLLSSTSWASTVCVPSWWATSQFHSETVWETQADILCYPSTHTHTHSRSWTCLSLWSWTTLTTWRGTGPSSVHTIWTSLRRSGQNMTPRPRTPERCSPPAWWTFHYMIRWLSDLTGGELNTWTWSLCCGASSLRLVSANSVLIEQHARYICNNERLRERDARMLCRFGFAFFGALTTLRV